LKSRMRENCTSGSVRGSRQSLHSRNYVKGVSRLSTRLISVKILVSACIMGVDCKYNGKNNKNLAAINYLKDKEIICICPEQLAGMTTPRPCAEIVNGVVTDENGNDVDLEYKRAVSMALSQIQHEDIELAILQSRSPTCGVNQIYDGSFTGKLISGMGLFAKALKERGIKVIDVEEVESFNLLDCPQLQSI
jgi:uncharacterized protein YbbK (DUF523 family)